MLTPDDASAIARDHFQAPSIVTQKDRTFLVATPVDTAAGNRYNGCRVYEFENPDTGTLLADGVGALVEVQRVDGGNGLHHGACETLEGLQGGIIYSQ